MNNRRLVTIIAIVGVAAIFTTSLPITQVKANHCHPGHRQTPKMDMKKSVRTRASSLERKPVRARALSLEKRPLGAETSSLEKIYSRDFPMAILSIAEAVKAIESGDRQTELVELNKALNMLLTVHSALGTHVKPQFANNLRCPIMGSAINLDMVGESLTRDYKGRKVAFCCAGCPSAWDKLSDAQKQAKVPGVKS